MSFKPGDVVVLKSGGPHMTVFNADSAGRFWCVWFGTDLNSMPKGQAFPVEALKLVQAS